MRTALLLAAALALSLAAPLAPHAQAAHMGPCWHEYVEAVLYSIGQSPKQILWNVGETVRGCTNGLLCDIIDPCVVP